MPPAALAKPLASPLSDAAPESLPCNNPAAEVEKAVEHPPPFFFGHTRSLSAANPWLWIDSLLRWRRWSMKTRVRDGRLCYFWWVRPLRLFRYGGTQ